MRDLFNRTLGSVTFHNFIKLEILGGLALVCLLLSVCAVVAIVNNWRRVKVSVRIFLVLLTVLIFGSCILFTYLTIRIFE